MPSRHVFESDWESRFRILLIVLFKPTSFNQIDWDIYMKAFQFDWAINVIINRLFGCM